MPSDHPNVLLVTSNGTGMGHLTRQLAVALALGDRATVTILSLSVGLPVVIDQGIDAEYCPSYERGWIPRRMWHRYLRDRLEAIIGERQIDVVMFDGVAPYPGLLNARGRLPDVGFVWMRRGMWRPEANTRHLGKGVAFDRIIEPGEIAAAADRGATAQATDAVRVPPLSMLEVVDRSGRAQAAAELGIDPDRPTVLLTLGSGMLGEVEAPGARALAALSEDPSWQICVTRPDVARAQVPVVDPTRVVELRGVYPLARYLSAFDAVVSAAGYNAVHEFVPARLPALFIPNAATRTDDQVSRASWLAEQGLALCAAEDDPHAIMDGVRALSDPAVRAELVEKVEAFGDERLLGGAGEAGRLLLELAGGFRPSPGLRVRRAIRLAEESLREGIKERLGPAGTARVRRLLGRDDAGAEEKLSVVVVGSWPGGPLGDLHPLLLTDHVAADDLRRGFPVEHTITGSSAEYRTRRAKIVEDFYDVGV